MGDFLNVEKLYTGMQDGKDFGEVYNLV